MAQFEPGWKWALSLIGIGLVVGITVAIVSKYLDHQYSCESSIIKGEELELLANSQACCYRTGTCK